MLKFFKEKKLSRNIEEGNARDWRKRQIERQSY